MAGSPQRGVQAAKVEDGPTQRDAERSPVLPPQYSLPDSTTVQGLQNRSPSMPISFEATEALVVAGCCISPQAAFAF